STRGDAEVRRLEAELQGEFATRVRIHVQHGTAGRIEIPFLNADDFQRVIEKLLGQDKTR
ncbi:MAG TPA: hypothetical protein VEY93_13600, partial [Longimicrobium sp.]|nr:hypothetical protein [Longimicrobium sp.]